MAADWWLLAGGVVLEAFGLPLGALWKSLDGSWEPLCSHLVPLGAIDEFPRAEWSLLVFLGSTLGGLGRSLGSF